MNINSYSEIPEKTTVSIFEWRNNADDSLLSHGVQWVSPRYIKEPVERTVEESSPGPNKRRKRTVPYAWYTEFKCHRFGTCCDKIVEGVRVKGSSKLINSNRSETIYSMQCLVPFNFFAPSLQRETQQPTAEENRPTTPASNG